MGKNLSARGSTAYLEPRAAGVAVQGSLESATPGFRGPQRHDELSQRRIRGKSAIPGIEHGGVGPAEPHSGPRGSAGYYGESDATGDLYPGWNCWFVSMISSCYTVHELLAGIASATAQESDPEIRGKIQTAQVMTVISWRLYGEVSPTSPALRPAAPPSGAGGTAGRALRPAPTPSGAGGTAHRRMRLGNAESNSKFWSLGLAAALMIVAG